jgi:multidrug transporter EmrE-like cation transporter
VTLNPWVLVLAAGVNSTVGNLLLKRSSDAQASRTLLENALNPWFIGGLAFYGINVILFARALADLPVSAAYPVLAGFSFLLLSVVSAWLLNERLTFMQYLGVFAVVVGIVLIGLASPRQA